MICWHRWSKWSEPKWFRVKFWDSWKAREVGEGMSRYQTRTCEKCGKTQEREVVAP